MLEFLVYGSYILSGCVSVVGHCLPGPHTSASEPRHFVRIYPLKVHDIGGGLSKYELAVDPFWIGVNLSLGCNVNSPVPPLKTPVVAVPMY